jgi:hypothetical protein
LGHLALDAQRFWLFQTFGAEKRSSVLSAPNASTAQMGCTCTTKLT